MTKQSTILLLIFLTLMHTGCDPDRVYDKSLAIEGDTWDRETVFQYDVIIDDSTSVNDFYINIRNNTDYPYSNLYLFFTTEFPNGHTTRDTIECILASKDGKWLGNGSGRIKDNEIMLQSAIRFPINGRYSFRIEQGMREDSLPGIEDIGIRIERTAN